MNIESNENPSRNLTEMGIPIYDAHGGAGFTVGVAVGVAVTSVVAVVACIFVSRIRGWYQDAESRPKWFGRIEVHPERERISARRRAAANEPDYQGYDRVFAMAPITLEELSAKRVQRPVESDEDSRSQMQPRLMTTQAEVHKGRRESSTDDGDECLEFEDTLDGDEKVESDEDSNRVVQGASDEQVIADQAVVSEEHQNELTADRDNEEG